MNQIRVMTYNIQHGHVHLSKEPGDEIDLTLTGRVMRETGADIIGLNEVNGRGVDEGYTAQTEFLGNYLGYAGYFGRALNFDGVNPYGNAVLSRFPIIEAKIIPIPDPYNPGELKRYFEHRCIVRTVIEMTDEKRLAVYSTHFGLNHEEAEHAATTALTVLGDESLPFVLMGDFNLTPDSPILAPLYRKLNPTDHLIPEEHRFTFPSHSPRIKIDYIFTGNGAEAVYADTVHVVASDHCPVFADIRF